MRIFVLILLLAISFSSCVQPKGPKVKREGAEDNSTSESITTNNDYNNESTPNDGPNEEEIPTNELPIVGIVNPIVEVEPITETEEIPETEVVEDLPEYISVTKCGKLFSHPVSPGIWLIEEETKKLYPVIKNEDESKLYIALLSNLSRNYRYIRQDYSNHSVKGCIDVLAHRIEGDYHDAKFYGFELADSISLLAFEKTGGLRNHPVEQIRNLRESTNYEVCSEVVTKRIPGTRVRGDFILLPNREPILLKYIDSRNIKRNLELLKEIGASPTNGTTGYGCIWFNNLPAIRVSTGVHEVVITDVDYHLIN